MWPWIILAALRVIPFMFLQNYSLPSGSMENTLLPGDSILAQVFPLRAPGRGQLIIFSSPRDQGVTLIKRVIAVPGDHLRITGDEVILNGNALDEKYVKQASGHTDFYPPNFPNDIELPECAEGHQMLSRQVVNGDIVIPAASYFVLGDNRDNSLDSRCWGFVRAKELIGKPLMIYDSVEKAGDGSPAVLGHRRWDRLFKFF